MGLGALDKPHDPRLDFLHLEAEDRVADTREDAFAGRDLLDEHLEAIGRFHDAREREVCRRVGRSRRGSGSVAAGPRWLRAGPTAATAAGTRLTRGIDERTKGITLGDGLVVHHGHVHAVILGRIGRCTLAIAPGGDVPDGGRLLVLTAGGDG